MRNQVDLEQCCLKFLILKVNSLKIRKNVYSKVIPSFVNSVVGQHHSLKGIILKCPLILSPLMIKKYNRRAVHSVTLAVVQS